MTQIPTGAEELTWLGTSYRTILDPTDSGGRMSIVDSTGPEGSGPPRHVHEAEDEVFVVLTGRCDFWLEGTRLSRGPGETVFIPRGAEHTFRVTEGPSRHLVILTPGGFEGFFAEMARGQFAIPEDMPAIEASAARHNLRFTGPPLGP
ncbi:cupin domain-containing protein [Pseudooceanicola sp. CBS1P-1]|uniref:Cupin domain-containing protein n=1 Tax=Pseudooceanicola albus TaxID=2692189 RepID=A0A6L7G843_9RHOB|nr:MULTISPECIES: cupin domain-containing protein [Pseudooceanicola]MBT9385878.1 cupin domain-containing protein [Pseudooceanicola endophyticus]MXN20109.1 cupin domain-containing protein [Pseudooceanicola albus]